MGKIPRDLFEDELVPLFEKAGPIWDLRLMMDPLSGLNRGYAFITFCTKEAAQQAVKLVSDCLLVYIQDINLDSDCNLSCSVTTMKFALGNTSVCASLLPTIVCLWGPSPRAKLRSRSWRSLPKLLVSVGVINCWDARVYVTLDHKTSHKGIFLEIEKPSIDVFGFLW